MSRETKQLIEDGMGMVALVVLLLVLLFLPNLMGTN